jgi:TIR domain
VAVRRIASALAERDVRVWLDEAGTFIGDELTETIRSAIVAADYVAIALSQKSIQSTWVEKEVAMAIAEEARLGREEKLILIKVEDCEVPEYLSRWEMINFTTTGSFEESLGLLLERLTSVGSGVEPSAGSERWPDLREAFAPVCLIKLHVVFYDGVEFTSAGRVGTNDDAQIDDLGLVGLAGLAGVSVDKELLSEARIAHLEANTWLHEDRTLANEGVRSGDHVVVALGAGRSATLQELVDGAARAVKAR